MKIKWAKVPNEERTKIVEAIMSAAESFRVKLRGAEWRDAGSLPHDQLVLDMEDALDREEKRDRIIEAANIDPPLNGVVLKPRSKGSSGFRVRARGRRVS